MGRLTKDLEECDEEILTLAASSSDPVEKRLTSVVEWVRGHLGHVNLVLMIELCSTSVSSPTSEVLSLGKFAPWKFVTFGDIFGHYSWLGDGDATAIEWVETEKLLDILQRVAPTIRAVQPGDSGAEVRRPDLEAGEDSSRL
jgi:hypothetical protein